ncbi:MAG: LTA synthase family protein [Bacteroidetes bacterium]|nr:LTA synthase family protein [Bacteroidota bacterium]
MLRYLVRLFVLLLFIFAISRIIFLVAAHNAFAAESWQTILASFYYGLKTDVSAACYILLLPALLAGIELIWESSLLYYLRLYYIWLVIFVNALVTSSEVGLYPEWGTKMNYKALLYLQHPSEIFHTASVYLLAGFVVLTLIQWIFGRILYRAIVAPSDTVRRKPLAAILIVPVAGLLFIGIRGGVQEIPMSAGDSYYTANPALNWAAVNSLWNLGQSVLAGRQYGRVNPYKLMPEAEAERIVNEMQVCPNDTSAPILTTRRPNIVLIVFEGWSAELISSISGNMEHSCTPHFDQLAASGLLFTNCLASGERSDQGLTAILSGFPALPLSSIANYTAKVDRLPSLLQPFKKEGYSSLFLFGGQLSYGNLNTLIYHNGFDKVIEEKNIDPQLYRGRLGVHDQHTFEVLRKELNTMHQPFFAGFFTQSTHFSYDYPGVKKTLSWAGGESDYANSLMYADSCLGDFIDKAKREPWFSHTLFILVADHSHVVPWCDDHRTAAMHHIPLLLYGDVLADAYRSKRIVSIVSQQDIPATLLTQTGHAHSEYTWSRDMLSSCSSHFAYWTFTEGMGFTTDSSELVYDLAGRKTISSHCNDDSALVKKKAFSYIQMVMEDFLRK